MKEDEAKETMRIIFRFLNKSCPLKVGMIVFYMVNAEDQRFMEIIPEGHYAPIDVMQVDLWAIQIMKK